MEVWVALVAGIIAAVALWWKSSVRGKPPGPWGLPIVGYLPFVIRKPHVAITKLGEKYGSVFTIRLGSFDILVLNDFQSTKEAYAQDAFIGRPPDSPFIMNKETVESGAFFGIQWKEQRKFSLHMLRDLGLGKTKMEEHIQEEIHDLLEQFEMNQDKPFCIRTLLASSTSNNIASLVFGQRMKYDDPVRQMFTKSMNETTEAANRVAPYFFFPWIKKAFEFLCIGDFDCVHRVSLEMRNYIMEKINQHEKTLNPFSIRDFIDSYLLEIKKRKNDPCFCKPVLQDIVGGLFGAGSETVRQTVEWLVLTAAWDQKAQRRIQAEIRDAIGYDRFPIWSDHKNMPYTNAFIMEVMRWRTLIPLNLLRYTLVDTELNGYFIPKHTQVISNFWTIHHDPAYWGPDAEDFRPERFLTDDGRDVKKYERFIPFSIGERSCPGEPLAKVEIFLYFIAILQRFSINLPKGKVADLEGEFSIGLQAKRQDIVFTKRE